MSPSERRGALPFPVCYPCLYVGITIGVCLAAVVVTWVLIANRDVSLEPYAVQRNLAAAGLLGFLMLLPAWRFAKCAGRVFLSGVIAWMIVSCVYGILTTIFVNLSARMGVFHLFVMGALIFGLEAVFVWLIHLALMARHQPLVGTRRLVSPRR